VCVYEGRSRGISSLQALELHKGAGPAPAESTVTAHNSDA
jgi:hypothetical protein